MFWKSTMRVNEEEKKQIYNTDFQNILFWWTIPLRAIMLVLHPPPPTPFGYNTSVYFDEVLYDFQRKLFRSHVSTFARLAVMQKAHAKCRCSGITQALVQWTATSGYIQMHRREPEVDAVWQPEPLDAQMTLNSFWTATPAKQKQNTQVLVWLERVSEDRNIVILQDVWTLSIFASCLFVLVG